MGPDDPYDASYSYMPNNVHNPNNPRNPYGIYRNGPSGGVGISGDPRIVRPLLIIGFIVFGLLPYLFF